MWTFYCIVAICITLVIILAMAHIRAIKEAAAKAPRDYSDDETLRKVYDALRLSGLNDQHATECVSMMQNAGILFRERR